MTTSEQTHRPAISLLHRDPPLRPAKFFFHRRAVFAIALIIALTLAVLATWEGGSILLNIDEPVAEWVAEVRTPAWDNFFAWSSRLGDNPVIFVLAALLAVWTWPKCRFLAAALVLAAAFRPLMEFVLKASIDRVRPDIAPLGDFRGPSHPSGHPMAAASLWGLIPAVVAVHSRSRLVWWTSAVAAVTVVVLVTAARVYRGAHWLTDVMASLAWASLYLAAVQGVFDKFHHDRDCVHPQHEMQAD